MELGSSIFATPLILDLNDYSVFTEVYLAIAPILMTGLGDSRFMFTVCKYD